MIRIQFLHTIYVSLEFLRPEGLGSTYNVLTCPDLNMVELGLNKPMVDSESAEAYNPSINVLINQ